MSSHATGRVSVLAIASIALATVGFFVIAPWGTLGALICGHLGLRGIKRSGGSVRGVGLARGCPERV